MERVLGNLEKRIVACRKCPRLVAHCRDVSRKKRRAYREWQYWGKPVPGFGDPGARILIVGLAPAAHGANRTGRIFTGDRSGDWLYGALFKAGLATQAEATHVGDGLELRGVFITATCRCAPPENKPTRAEIDNCRPYLEAEFRALKNVKAILALGKVAFDSALNLLENCGAAIPRPRPKFGHQAKVVPGTAFPLLIASYHPSQQNTQTGRLTRAMLDAAIEDARQAAVL